MQEFEHFAAILALGRDPRINVGVGLQGPATTGQPASSQNSSEIRKTPPFEG